MTKSQILLSGGLTYFPTFVAKFKSDKIPNYLCLGRGYLTYFPTFIAAETAVYR